MRLFAELKDLYCTDIDDMEVYQPENPDSFAIYVQAMIGIKGGDGYESFDIQVCTPKWMDENYGREDVRTGQHLLIVKEYNYRRLVRFIENYLMHCSGNDWQEIAEKVGQLGRWEFENYTEFKG